MLHVTKRQHITPLASKCYPWRQSKENISLLEPDSLVLFSWLSYTQFSTSKDEFRKKT